MKITASYIHIDNLRFHAYHGVLPQERLTGNDYLVNLRIAYPYTKACLTDEVEDTLNYAAVYQIIAQEMLQPSKLLEHVAHRIGQQLCQTFPQISTIQLKITKINPPMQADALGAGVELWIENDEAES